MLGRMIRTTATGLLHEAGLATRAACERAHFRARKAILALEHAQEEKEASSRHAVKLQRQLDLAIAGLEESRLAGQDSERRAAAAALDDARAQFQQRVQELELQIVEVSGAGRDRILELERQIVALTQADHDRIRELEERYGRRLEELESQHRLVLAELSDRHEKELAALVDLRARDGQRERDQSDQFARSLVEAVQDTHSARQELMMVEVKLDVLEAAVNILDRRTRVAGVLPSLVQRPALRPQPRDDLATMPIPIQAQRENGAVVLPRATEVE
jgi:hypothetical protein